MVHLLSCNAPQDTDYAVRICMCWQLPALARALGREAAAEKLLPEALEVGWPRGRGFWVVG